MYNTKIKALAITMLTIMCFASCGSDDDNGTNGGISERNDNKNTVFEDHAATRIEVPHLRGGNSKFIVYRTNDKTFDKDGVNFCVEWDKDLKANRWTCYVLTKQNVSGSANRWKGDYNTPETSSSSAYFFDLNNLTIKDYWHYTDSRDGGEHCYIHNARGLDHGHLCPSNDRTYSADINKQTFYITNMQPQYSVFNGSAPSYQYKGLWLTMEKFVHDFSKNYKFASNDTLFVCKGGTIDNADQILMRVDNKLIVPKYYYAALVWKHTNDNKYYGIAFWFEHINVYHGDDTLSGYAISIDELENKLGNKIDFFCNLPDEIENKVEKTAAIMSFGL